jgi:hypothetical protein
MMTQAEGVLRDSSVMLIGRFDHTSPEEGGLHSFQIILIDHHPAIGSVVKQMLLEKAAEEIVIMLMMIGA